MQPGEYERSYALEAEHWWFRAKRALIMSLLRRFAPGARHGLDLGCGTGGMLAELAREPAGTVWVGLDAEALALAFARRRGGDQLVQASAVRLPFRAESFDTCLCLDVLYHRAVDSDRAALGECHRVLRGNGLLLVTDSAFAWLRSAHDEAVHGARRYTRGELLARIRAAGFTPLFTSYAYCLVFPAVVAFRLARRVGGTAGRGSDVFPVPGPVTRLLSGVQALERGLLRLIPLPFGSSVVCVARKAPG